MMKYKGCGTTTMIQNKCRTPPPAKPSYFLSVSITSRKSRAFSETTPKVRIKIPKLLAQMTAVKKKKKKKKHHSNNGDRHELSIRRKRINFPIKVGSLFSSVISSKKSLSCVAIRNKNYSCKSNGKECKSRVLVTEDKSKALVKTAVEDSTLVTSERSVISLETCEGSPCSASLNIGRAKDKLVEEEEANSKRPGSITTLKLHSRSKFSFRGLLNGRTGLKLTRGKRNAARCPGDGNELVHGKSSPMIRTSEEEASDCQELCKKRILLGERCRPVNFGGILQ